MEANGSILTDKYSEGLPTGNACYYSGNEWIDELEGPLSQTSERSRHFTLTLPSGASRPSTSLSFPVLTMLFTRHPGSFAALAALLQPQDRLMGLGLPDGGHLTHRFYVNLIHIFFSPQSYHLLIPGTVECRQRSRRKRPCRRSIFNPSHMTLDSATQLIDYSAAGLAGSHL